MKILLVDDHSLFTEGLVILLQDFDQSLDLVCCNSCESALEQPQLEKVELVLLDYYLPGLSGVDALTKLREACPNSRISVVSALDKPDTIRQLIDAGAAGFVPKTATFAVMSAALKLVLAGGIYLPPQVVENKQPAAAANLNDRLDNLSQRQREVILQVVQGKPNKVIAKTLNISEHTVKAHISASFKLLGVKNRTEAVYATAKGYWDDQPMV